MPEFADHRLTVETARFGPFTFQVGVNPAAVETALLRVGDAHQRLQGSPLAQVAGQLEPEVVATSVFGTNSIEGGTLSEEETRLALDYECIHPFWDGNGRVGRVIEASLLLREGFKYAPFAQARFYLDQIDRYFTLFNTCRKAAERAPRPPTQTSCSSSWKAC
ncbi:Fic family protein [Candidatus Thiodictyon syntrophicum]|jgi:hypothetical protein|uniref:Fido domain-containing protein n=1 Tax=Candidatus Thiodictyon syntrophicum TaxID=1166950 RepID=A0A2K8U638_9GAMM|nr:Fic family protein [Candidatus Thiodictyon syntrophicum]AUB81043.1 hypothetical protein THSYN_08825 [Candidatus Thiodictyon syntrophicum]